MIDIRELEQAVAFLAHRRIEEALGRDAALVLPASESTKKALGEQAKKP